MATLVLVSVAGMAAYDFVVKPWLAGRLSRPNQSQQPDQSGGWSIW